MSICIYLLKKKKPRNLKKGYSGIVGEAQLLSFAFMLQNEGVEWKGCLLRDPTTLCVSQETFFPIQSYSIASA